MMEKIVFQNSRGLNLVGILYRTKSKSAIIICHGFTANKDRVRLQKLAEALNKDDFAVLRFDFSGCGESDEDLITVKAEVDDLKSAITFMKNKGYNNIGLWGESLGGLISLMGYDEKIKAIVLWAPVTDKRKPKLERDAIDSNESFSEKNDEFMIYKKEGREFKIKKEYFEERASVKKEKLLLRIKCPVLIIHGDRDITVPLEWSKTAIHLLPKESRLEIIKGAGHKPEEKIDKVISLSVDWFKKYLAP